MPENDKLRAALTGSIKLLELGEKQDALELLDDSIAEAIQEGRVAWVIALSHHAAILCRHTGEPQSAKRYYEQSLSVDAENPRALYGLAYVAREQGKVRAQETMPTDVTKPYCGPTMKSLNRDCLT